MKAIRVHQTGAPEVLTLEEVADPQPGPSVPLLLAGLEQVKASGSEVLRHQLQSSMAALRYASRTEISCTPPQHGHLTRNLDFQDARRVRTSASTRVGARSFVFGQMKVSNGSAKAISCVAVNR
jgi:hypothetical protein